MRRQFAKPYTGPTLLGVDLSRHNADDVLVGLERPPEFAFIRYADGTTLDTKARHWVGYCVEHGIPWDFYLYVRAYHGAEAQIEPLLDAREQFGACMFPVIDIEDGQNRGAWYRPDSDEWLDTSEVYNVLTSMEHLCHFHTGGCIIYGGQALHFRILQGTRWFPDERTTLWTPYPTVVETRPRVPVYTHPQTGKATAWDPWTFWQHTTRLEGRHLDGNLYRGDRNSFAEEFAYAPYLDPSANPLVIVEIDRDAGEVVMQSESSILRRLESIEARLAKGGL